MNAVRRILNLLAPPRTLLLGIAIGILIGVGALVGWIQWTYRSSSRLPKELTELTAFILVQPTPETRRGRQTGDQPIMTEDDAKAIGSECNSVVAYSPLVHCSKPVTRGTTCLQPRDMWGVGFDYLRVGRWTIQAGEFFTEHNETEGHCVCVIGHKVVSQLFPVENPIGQQIQVGDTPFKVVGVLEKRGRDFLGNDSDNIMLMPYTTVKRLQGCQLKGVNYIAAAARTPKLVESAKMEIQQLMNDRHNIAPGQKANFEVVSSVNLSRILR